MGFMNGTPGEVRPVRISPEGLEGLLGVPSSANGLVIFAHGSGSGRLSPRNNRVAAALRDVGLATLLLDLLRPEEEMDRANVFDIQLLASRLVSATNWASANPDLSALRVGYFGASTGAGAALERVRAPTLLIVGGADGIVIELNRFAYERLQHVKELVIIPGAGHLFEEPGTLDQVMDDAKRWFLRFLPRTRS